MRTPGDGATDGSSTLAFGSHHSRAPPLPTSRHTGSGGLWKYEAGPDSTLAMSFENTAYSRVFTTKGSLTSVFGGDETTRTSSSYDIPEGSVVLRVPMKLAHRQYVVDNGTVQWSGTTADLLANREEIEKLISV